jgi:16S rRNA (cytidine1402-2'-O)-methyltransferase
VPESSGSLYIVATPIGNLEDLSPRARRILAEVDVVLCEDTRHTGQMLTRLGISTRRTSLHEHNEEEKVGEILAGLKAGRSYALVSDAGTPLISDPGYRLLAAVRGEDLPARSVPGPCAAIAAISIAGLPTDRFCFEGFLPARAAARRAKLDSLAAEERTLIFYESGRRLADTVRDCAAVLGDKRDAAVAREMTKTFEALYRGSLGELERQLEADENSSRGESVLVISGAAGSSPEAPELAKTMRVLLEFVPPSTAARIAARIFGVPRREAYRLATDMGAGDDPSSV